MKKTRLKDRLEQIKAMCPIGAKFVIIPGHVIFVAMIYEGGQMTLMSFKDYTEPSNPSELYTSNYFKGLIPHGGVEILMFSDGFGTDEFAVKFNSNFDGAVHISRNEEGVLLDNSYGLEFTKDPARLVLDKVTSGHMNTKPSIEAWSKNCRLSTFGLLLCMKLFGGNELISSLAFLVGEKSYSVRVSHTLRKCSDFHLTLSSNVSDYFIHVVTCRLKKITRVYKPIASSALLSRETPWISETQAYDEGGFPMSDFLQTYFDFNHITQPINLELINKARNHFGIQDAHDYGFNADPICTSICDSFLQLMIDGHITKRVQRDTSEKKPVGKATSSFSERHEGAHDHRPRSPFKHANHRETRNCRAISPHKRNIHEGTRNLRRRSSCKHANPRETRNCRSKSPRKRNFHEGARDDRCNTRPRSQWEHDNHRETRTCRSRSPHKSDNHDDRRDRRPQDPRIRNRN